MLEAYAIFALATAFTANYSLYNRVLNKLKENHPTHNLIEYSVLSHATFFLMSVLIAPLIFICLVDNNLGDAFVNSMHDGIEKD